MRLVLSGLVFVYATFGPLMLSSTLTDDVVNVVADAGEVPQHEAMVAVMESATNALAATEANN